MKRLTILIAGVSLFACNAIAGGVSNVSGTLDTTLVDPAPQLYPHFICASGCSSGSNLGGAVSQAGAWTVGISNFPTTQSVTGAVSVSNLPATQAINGSVSVSNLPTIQAISGAVTIGGSVAFGVVGGPSPFVETIQGVPGGAPLGVSETDGSDATLGSKADAASGNGSASVVAILKQIHLDSIGSLPPGSSSIGSVSINPYGNTVQPQGFAPFAALSLANNCYAYGSPATLFFVGGYAPQSNLWALIYNTNSTPADGTASTPVTWFGPFPNSGDWDVTLPAPITLSAGMTLCYSTTGPGTKTSTSGIATGGAFKGVHN